jgi:hypothetical protein
MEEHVESALTRVRDKVGEMKMSLGQGKLNERQLAQWLTHLTNIEYHLNQMSGPSSWGGGPSIAGTTGAVTAKTSLTTSCPHCQQNVTIDIDLTIT